MYVIDYANMDRNRKPTPQEVRDAKAKGLGGVIIRGSWDKWQDDNARRDADVFRAEGVPFGAYCGPSYYAGESMSALVRVFKAGAGLVPGQDFIPWIDAEYGNKGIDGTHETRAQCGAQLGDLRKAMQDEFGVDPGLYGSKRVMDGNDMDALAGAADAYLADMDMWLARYPYATGIDAQLAAIDRLPGPPVPRCAMAFPGDDDAWLAHQFQGDAHHIAGASNQADVDRWHLATPTIKDGARRRRMIRRLEAWLIRIGSRDLAPTAQTDPRGDAIVAWLDRTIRAYQTAKGKLPDAVVGPLTFAPLGWEK